MSRREDLPRELMALGPDGTRGLFLLLYPLCGWMLSGLLTLAFLPLFEPVSALALGWGPWAWMALTGVAVRWGACAGALPAWPRRPSGFTRSLIWRRCSRRAALGAEAAGICLCGALLAWPWAGANLRLLFPGVLRCVVRLASGGLFSGRVSGMGPREDGAC